MTGRAEAVGKVEVSEVVTGPDCPHSTDYGCIGSVVVKVIVLEQLVESLVVETGASKDGLEVFDLEIKLVDESYVANKVDTFLSYHGEETEHL